MAPPCPDRTATPPECVRVFYTGRVQGIGFRATAVEAARRLGLAGWVRNLDDGRVELRAQGPPATLARLLASIRERFAANLASEACDEPPAGERPLPEPFAVRR